MSIKSITLDKVTFMDLAIGLPELPLEKSLEMRSLGPVVLLAGPNGAGKSRVLRLVSKLLLKMPSAGQRESTDEGIRRAEDATKAAEETLVLLQGSQGLSVPKKHEEDVQAAQRQAAQSRSERERLVASLKITEVIDIDTLEVPLGVEFVPQVPVLENPAKYTDTDVSARAKQMQRLGSHAAEQNAPAYLRETMKSVLRARWRQEGDAAVQDVSKRQADLLRKLRDLLGPQFSLDLDNSFNLAIGENALDALGLSHGQQVLFQFACLLHAQGQEVGDCVILMDEPENHLHPAVINDVIDTLRRNLRTGQLWIATHSVPLIAHLTGSDPDCLWLVQDGHVQSAKRSPELVLHSLMGGPDGARHLHEFTLLPAQYAALRFMAQCLEPPKVAEVDVNDPQTKQIRALLAPSGGEKLRLLDFGAGKGRLLATLAAGPTPATDWLDYLAFEPYAENDGKELLRAVSVIYGEDAHRHVHLSQDTLKSRVDAGSIDVVVMCNVLHELRPAVWLDWFGPTGEITRLLRPEGKLLLVEDYGLPVGERAHEYGFLLLDEDELVPLFSVQESDRQAGRFVRDTPSIPSFRDRLVAFAIDRMCVERATAKTIHAAITTLKDRTRRAISAVLAEPVSPTSKEGRAYARNAHLHASAQIWLHGNPAPA